jgi:hypothetical protein
MWSVARRGLHPECADLAARLDETRVASRLFAVPRPDAANSRADGWYSLGLVAAVLAVAEGDHHATFSPDPAPHTAAKGLLINDTLVYPGLFERFGTSM